MQSRAATVAEYLASLPPDRRAAIEAVRRVILKNLDKGYQETMQYGAIGYSVPHSIYPAGYHCDPKQPLPFAGLGSQKNHMSLGIMCHYYTSEENRWFRRAWTSTGRKLDMGACCVRFKRLEDVPLEVVGEAVRRIPVKAFIACYEAALAGRGAAKRKKAAPKAGRRSAGRKKPTRAGAPRVADRR